MTTNDPANELGTTLSQTVRRDHPNPLGYRTLTFDQGEPYQIRLDLGGTPPGYLRALACFIHLSDLHVTDVQSPARAEFLDRFGDADSPYAAELGRVGVYRSQEALTAQVVEAMAQAASRLERGPLTGGRCTFALSTGDATDNCQDNELDAYLGLLDGGHKVSTDSGEIGRYQGVGSTDFFDERYWHPDGSPEGEPLDRPHRLYGFPNVPGLLEASLVPIASTGLAFPWYAVYGNHDALFGGTLYPHGALGTVAVGTQKPIGIGEGVDPRTLLLNNETEPSPGKWGMLSSPTQAVTADPARRPVTGDEWIARHLCAPDDRVGHGLAFASPGRCFYGFDVGVVRFLVLDTVNAAGGWQGSIDDEQFHWLEDELVAGSSSFYNDSDELVAHETENRLFVLVSHHPIETLINNFGPSSTPRHLEDDVRDLLGRFPNVVCWVNGHTHCNTVRSIVPESKMHPGFWQITTASHIDWPQQSRIIELALDESGDIVIGCAMIDHLGSIHPRSDALDDVHVLAGWSRELSANAWQGHIGDEPMGRGTEKDRNVILIKPAPFGVTK